MQWLTIGSQPAPGRHKRGFFVTSKLELNSGTPRNQHRFDGSGARPNCFGTYYQRDTRLTREEWIVKYGSDDGFDAYSKGLAEFAAVRAAKDFGAIDRNHDHKLSREEWIAMYGTEEGFDAYDLDGDGFVDETEFALGQASKQRFSDATSKSGARYTP